MKTVMITGASRGIGRETAIRFASPDTALVLCCEKEKDSLEEVREIAEKKGSSCLLYEGDLSVFENAEEAVKNAIGRFSKIDILINSAGISLTGLFTDTDPSDLKRIMDVNLGSVYNCCRNVLPFMLSENKGRIINISSIWGITGAACEVLYSASKAAVIGFTKALGKEYALSGIRINAIAPGAVDTDMNNCLSEEDREILLKELPMGRMARPDEIADFVYDVAIGPDYLNAQVLSIDGGIS